MTSKFGGGYAVDPGSAPGATPLPATDPAPIVVYCHGSLTGVIHHGNRTWCGGCGEQLNWLVPR